jgi:mannose-1-phosphate guanylyltransferase
VALRYAVESEPLDTAGAIRFAAEAAGIDDTFVVANGDVLTDLDVSELLHFHRERRALATIALIGVPDPSAFGVVALDADQRVERFVEKPAPGTAPSNLINAGTYVLEPSVLQRIPSGQKVSIERATFPALVADGGLYAMATDDYWLDTGRPELYLQANLDIVAGRRRHDRCVAVHEHADVAPDVSLTESIVAGGATVGAGATLVRSVVLSGAVIGAGAVVTDSVVMGQVGDRAQLHNSVIGADGIVAAGEHVHAERRPDPDAT